MIKTIKCVNCGKVVRFRHPRKKFCCDYCRTKYYRKYKTTWTTLELVRWKGNPNIEEQYRHDYRWIKNSNERMKWIIDHWEIEIR